MSLIMASMNAASLKFKKDIALKRDSKRSAAELGKSQSLKGATAHNSEVTGRRKSLVTFEDSKAEKQFFEKSYAMWNLLDRFSRAKVCERVLHKIYRSNRNAVKDYCTNLLPKWESWKAAEDIRDSVKFQIGDVSRRKRWNDSGTMAAPEYPRLRFRKIHSVLCTALSNILQVVAAFCGVAKANWRDNFRGTARKHVQLWASTTCKRQGWQSCAAQKALKFPYESLKIQKKAHHNKVPDVNLLVNLK
jgi:hypothetical protein